MAEAIEVSPGGGVKGGGSLWRFSLAFYERPGVPEALIALQDRADLDVNLILFALWLGISRCCLLTGEKLAAAERAVHLVRTEIVEPLRAMRRRLRPAPDADVQGLRAGIKALELAAEQVAQTRLGRLADPMVSDAADRAARLAAASANLARYLGPEMMRSTEADVIREALEAWSRDQ